MQLLQARVKGCRLCRHAHQVGKRFLSYSFVRCAAKDSLSLKPYTKFSFLQAGNLHQLDVVRGPSGCQDAVLEAQDRQIHRVFATVAPQATGQGIFAGAVAQNRDVLVLADRRTDAAQNGLLPLGRCSTCRARPAWRRQGRWLAPSAIPQKGTCP